MDTEEQLVETYHSPFGFLKNTNILHIIFVVCFSLLTVYVGFISAPSNFPENSIYNLKSGQTLSVVSSNFKEQKIIRSEFFFKTFIYLFSFGDSRIIAGNYALHSKQNVMTLAWRVSNGVLDITPVKITIPEGMNSFEIANLISSQFPAFNKKVFSNIVESRKLEGYLFPDTYFLMPDMTEEEIIKIMKDNFDERIQEVREEIKRFGKSESDVIKMASILEGEARLKDTREIVAGILWKRLSIGMALQVDTSFKYINGKTSATLTSEDLKMDSPYNSYTRRGLPPTAISNPGLDAIKAAINPKKTAYLYFLTDKEGNMHYASTFEQHVANKLKYLISK